MDVVLEAPDGGWGWVVTVADFFVDFLVGIPKHSFGVTYSRCFTELGTPATTVSVIYNFAYVFSYTISFLVGPIIQEFGWRVATFTSGFLCALGFVISAFATSALHIFLSFSVVSGVNIMFLTTIVYTIIPHYFTHKATLANGLVTSGFCVGQFVFPLVITTLHEEYGFTGSTLITGGFLFNICVAAMVFHPVEWHARRRSIKALDTLGNDASTIKVIGAARKDTEKQATEEVTRNKTSNDFETTNITDASKCLDKERKCTRNKTDKHDIWEETRGKNVEKTTRHEPNQYIKTTKPTGKDAENQTTKGPRRPQTPSRCAGIMRRMMYTARHNLLLLRSLSVLIIIATVATNFFVLINIGQVVPFAMLDEGFTMKEAALCLTVFGACNFSSKLLLTLLTYITDISYFSVYMAGNGIAGIALLVFSHMEVLIWRAVTLGLCGFGIAAVSNFIALLVVEQLGLPLLLPFASVLSLVSAFFMLILGVLLGVTYDLTGNYFWSECFLVGCMVLSTALLLFFSAAKAFDIRRGVLQGTETRQGTGTVQSTETEQKKQTLKATETQAWEQQIHEQSLQKQDSTQHKQESKQQGQEFQQTEEENRKKLEETPLREIIHLAAKRRTYSSLDD